MIKEACVGDFAAIKKMIAAGADRIELNDNLAEGGTTPSYGTISQAVNYAHGYHVPVVVMIRPRGGNFIYSEDEIAIMQADMQTAAKLDADAVTFGCLKPNGELDYANMTKLLALAHALKLTVVMHMAFDDIKDDEQKAALNWLAAHGVKRILTHGGSLQQPITANLPHLKEIIAWAADKIAILPGGGINVNNRDQIAQELGVKQLHGSKIVLLPE